MREGSVSANAHATESKPARDRVFDAAADLFYRKGIHAVGVEEIVKTAGVAKIYEQYVADYLAPTPGGKPAAGAR